MKRFIFIGILSLMPGCVSCGGDDAVLPHVLRVSFVDGFNEYEFLAGGKLLNYQYNPPDLGAPELAPDPHRQIDPFLSVEALRWKMEGNKLLMGRDNRHMFAWQYEKERGYFFFWDTAFTEEKEVRFFEILSQTCGDPAFHHGEMAQANEKDAALSTNLPFRFLHIDTPAGFTEYEFRPDGKLIAYSDLEKAPKTGKYVSMEVNQPSFKLQLFRWQRKGKQIVINHGDKEETMQAAADGTKAISDGEVWMRMDHLEFIPRIFAYCERPLPKAAPTGRDVEKAK
jgi:hypothetical protein